MPVRCRWPLALPLLCLLACSGPSADPPPPAVDPPAPTSFDPGTCGTITGTVRWEGEAPVVEPFRSIDEPLGDQPHPPARDWPNPNAPRLSAGRGLAGTAVFLREVDPVKSRPWDHPPPRVEMRDQAFAAHVAFARVGDQLEIVSRDDRLHVAQARGAAFFALTLPRPDSTRSRRLDRPGVVELLSGSGYFWMRAYVHVSRHPYLTRTDAEGRYRLEQVPAGEYELVAWHPNWRVAQEQRNPDLFRVQQVRFAAPLESSRRVRVGAKETATSDLVLR